MQDNDDFGTPEDQRKMWRFVGEQCLQLGEVVKRLRAQPPAQFRFANLLFNAVVDSSHSLMLLLENNKIRDCLPLARCVLETTINVCYISAIGSRAASQAVKHAVQKAHRDNLRGFEFRSTNLKIGWTAEPILPTDPIVKAALAEYTSRRGREITSWTAETLEERVEAIETWLGKNLGDRLRFSIFAIYRFSSEIAHGTLYSVLRFVGVWDIPPATRSPASIALHQGGLGVEAALNVANCINIATHAGCKLIGDPGLARVADDLFAKVKDRVWAQNTTIGNDGRLGKADPPQNQP